MEYDEIDQYVDQLFRDDGNHQSNNPLGKTGNGDWRLDRIDQTAEDAYEDAVRWHKARIAEGTDPRSGLRSIPSIPWDERIDGVAAMMGAAGYAESSYERNGDPRYQSQHQLQEQHGGLSCGEVVLITIVVIICLIFMVMAS